MPLWCWRSFIHDKHEAFRFKYDTKKLSELEAWMNKTNTIRALYVNAICYYIIMFVCPFVFTNECKDGGIQVWSHIIYGIYSLITIVLEIILVLQI